MLYLFIIKLFPFSICIHVHYNKINKFCSIWHNSRHICSIIAVVLKNITSIFGVLRLFSFILQYSTSMKKSMIIQFITCPLKQCNIVQRHEVEEALRGVDCVYHMASYGMSGREQVRYICEMKKVSLS